MRLHHTLIVLPFIAAMFACTAPPAPQTSKPVVPPISSTPHSTPAPGSGETVSDIGNSCWYVFQDKDNNFWFGTDGNGVCRYDGKTVTRFTTKDGLSHDSRPKTDSATIRFAAFSSTFQPATSSSPQTAASASSMASDSPRFQSRR
jgi:hypothetical protein